MSVRIRELQSVDLKGGIAIDGFPSTGLSNAIAAECIIEALSLKPVAVIDSDQFPSLSTIYDSVPYFPARIHASEDLKLAVFISELTLNDPMLKPMARIMLEWVRGHNCSLVLGATGFPVEAAEKSEDEVLAAGSTPNALKRIRDSGMTVMEHGAVAGIPGILLSEGKLLNLDVIVFLVNVLKDQPDFRAAAIISEVLGNFAPSCRCNISSLLVEAEKVEKRMKKIQSDSDARREGIYG